MRPPNEKAPRACDSQGFGDQPTDPQIVADLDIERNRFTALEARAKKGN